MQSQLLATTYEDFGYASLSLQLSAIVPVALIEFLGLVRGTTATCNKLVLLIRKMVLVKVEVMGGYPYELTLNTTSLSLKKCLQVVIRKYQ
jgi:hypothetical protein